MLHGLERALQAMNPLHKVVWVVITSRFYGVEHRGSIASRPRVAQSVEYNGLQLMQLALVIGERRAELHAIIL